MGWIVYVGQCADYEISQRLTELSITSPRAERCWECPTDVSPFHAILLLEGAWNLACLAGSLRDLVPAKGR